MMAGIFPYLEAGELLDSSGEQLVPELPLTKYEGGQFASSSGEVYDATAYCPARTPDGIDVVPLVVGKSNRRLMIDGERHTIAGAVHHQFIGQVELQLNRALAA